MQQTQISLRQPVAQHEIEQIRKQENERYIWSISEPPPRVFSLDMKIGHLDTEMMGGARINWNGDWLKLGWNVLQSIFETDGERIAKIIAVDKDKVMRVDGHTFPLYCWSTTAFYAGYADILLHLAEFETNLQAKLRLLRNAKTKLLEADKFWKGGSYSWSYDAPIWKKANALLLQYDPALQQQRHPRTCPRVYAGKTTHPRGTLWTCITSITMWWLLSPYPIAIPHPYHVQTQQSSHANDFTQNQPVTRKATLTPMQKALIRGHRWLDALETGQAKALADLAQQANVDPRYVNHMLNLTTLAPDIVADILDDKLPQTTSP